MLSMFTESTMDDIAHFDIAPQILNLLTIIDSLHLKILRLASRKFKFRTIFFASFSSRQFSLQIVTSSSYSRQLFCCKYCKLSFLTPFLQIIALEFFQEHFTNYCSGQLLCKLFFQTTFLQISVANNLFCKFANCDNCFATCCSGSICFKFCKSQTNPTTLPTLSTSITLTDLKHLTTLATLTTPPPLSL